MGRPKKSEWEESKDSEPVILSDFEHQLFLLGDIEKKREIKNEFEFLNKELQLSNLSAEEAQLFVLKLECVQDWYNMGFKTLAERRFLKLISRFRIKRSVSGFERLMQRAIPSVSAEIAMRAGEATKATVFEQEEGEEEGIFSKLYEKIKKRGD